MKLLDIFKRKAKDKQAVVIPPSGTVTADEPKELSQEELFKKQKAAFDEWYSKLTPEMRRRVDNKVAKLMLKQGTPVVCIKCKKAGSNKESGPFRKVDGGYIHQNCQVAGIRG